MSIFQSLKNHTKSVLPILLVFLATIQITACNSQSSSVTNDQTTSNISNPNTNTGNGATYSNLTLAWIAPSERENNQPILLSDIAGYKIYYGNTQGTYKNSVTINDSVAENYTFTTLPTGTYYIVMTTLDTGGRESQFSSELTITI